jgi:hypothetical protein
LIREQQAKGQQSKDIQHRSRAINRIASRIPAQITELQQVVCIADKHVGIVHDPQAAEAWQQRDQAHQQTGKQKNAVPGARNLHVQRIFFRSSSTMKRICE